MKNYINTLFKCPNCKETTELCETDLSRVLCQLLPDKKICLYVSRYCPHCKEYDYEDIDYISIPNTDVPYLDNNEAKVRFAIVRGNNGHYLKDAVYIPPFIYLEKEMEVIMLDRDLNYRVGVVTDIVEPVNSIDSVFLHRCTKVVSRSYDVRWTFNKVESLKENKELEDKFNSYNQIEDKSFIDNLYYEDVLIGMDKSLETEDGSYCSYLEYLLEFCPDENCNKYIKVCLSLDDAIKNIHKSTNCVPFRFLIDEVKNHANEYKGIAIVTKENTVYLGHTELGRILTSYYFGENVMRSYFKEISNEENEYLSYEKHDDLKNLMTSYIDKFKKGEKQLSEEENRLLCIAIERYLEITQSYFYLIDDEFRNKKRNLTKIYAAIFGEDVTNMELVNINKAGRYLNDVLDDLSEAERQVVTHKYGLDNGHPYSNKEIADMFGQSEEEIQSMLAKSIQKLKHPIRQEKLKKCLFVKKDATKSK